MAFNEDDDMQALSPLVTKRPTMKEIENYVIQQTVEGAGVVIHWERLGLELGESQNILDVIKRDHHDITSCCREMLNQWLTRSPAATWNNLIKALNDLNLPVASRELKKSLMKKVSAEKESLFVSTAATGITNNGGTLSLDFSEEDDIEVAFRKLTWKVIDLLECKPISRVTMECHSFCRRYYGKEKDSLFFKHIKQASSMQELFSTLDDSPFYNFLNIKILVHLAKMFNLKDLSSLIDNFKSAYGSMPFQKILSLHGIQRFIVEGGENIDLVKVKVKFTDGNITYGYIVEHFVCSLSYQVLQVDVGSMLPYGFLQSSIIIEFLIPSYLKVCAIQSAFCSMQVLSMLKVALIEIGSYRIECGSENANASPIQILYKCYDFLLKNLKPSIATEILSRKKLLHVNDEENINIAPSQYTKNFIIMEHLRCVDVPSLFVFCYELKKNDEQQYVGSFMLNALESAGFSVTNVPHDKQLMCYDSLATATMPEDKFKSLRHRKKSMTLSRNTVHYQLNFMDFIDQLCEALESNVPDTIEIFKRKCNELMASTSRRIKLFPPAYLKILCQCTHITMLLRVLSPYLTWCSHSILSLLVESCNNAEVLELLNNFNVNINETQPLSSCAIPTPSYVMTPDENSSYTILTTKINTNYSSMTLKDISEVKHTMADKFKITEHSFQFLAMNKDLVIFYWIILKAIVPIICAQMQQCQEYFKEKGWTEICIYPSMLFKIDGHVKLGSLAYLQSEYSEKWDDTIKSQLNRIEVLPELLVNYNQELDVIKKVQDDDKDQRILTLNRKIAQLEEDLAESRSHATSYYKENLLLVKRCSDLKESLMIQFVKIQDLEYLLCDLHENTSKQAFLRENKGTQTDLHEGMQQAKQKAWDFDYTEDMTILKSKYLRIRFLSEENSWPPVHFKVFANLAYVYYKSNNVNSAQKILTASATSKVVTTQMLIHEIFEPMEEPVVQLPKRILIEGNPGTGKTTLTKEICYQWAAGNLLQSDKLVLLLVSRDPNVQKITCLMELIQYFFPPTIKLNAIVKNLEIATYQNQITIIIDGFDELSLVIQQKSFLRDIIEGKVLKDAKVLITSRPFASITLHHYVDKRIEIMGFGEDSRQQYICEIFKDKPDYLKQLHTHFHMYPNIDALCYNPLFFTIVVFMCLLESLPSTATEMFTSFVVHSINYHLQKVGKSIVCIDSIERLPIAVQKTLYVLEKLAFTGLLEDKIVFTLADLPDLCKDDPSCYGLLQLNWCYTTKEMHHSTQSFCFLHLEMQQYLAARYVARLPNKETSSLLEDSFLPQDEEFLFSNDSSFVNSFRSSHIRFANMWIYYFGLVGTKTFVECFLSNYRSSSFKESKSFIMESQFNPGPVAEDIFRSPVNVLFLFRCFQEAKDNEKHVLISSYFGNSIILTGYKLQPYQVTSLGFFLSKSRKEWEELNLYNCYILDHGASILYNYLVCNEVTIKKINLCNNNLTAASSSFIGNLITNVKANCALLSNNIINIDGIITATPKISFLKELWLMETGITKHEARSLVKLLDIGLVELYISRNKLGDEGADILSHAVCKSTTLKVLDISSNEIKANGTKAMALALQNSKSLNTLWIGGNAIGHEGAKAIADGMLHSKILKELLLNGDETVDTELALLLLNKAIESTNVILLYLPRILSAQDQNMLRSHLLKINSESPRNYAPLQLEFL